MAFLVPMLDGGIEEIYTDSWSVEGCETCDYGSSYVNEFKVDIKQGTIHIKYDQMYNHAVSEDLLMKVFLTNVNRITDMTETEFVEWLETELTKQAGQAPDVYNFVQ